jgi:pilus assembly protein Flp/PilA
METKQWYQSKIVWVNILATITAMLDALKIVNIPPEYLAAGATVVALANVVLRIWFTDAPIETGKPDPAGEEIGQGMVEYALILALVAVVVIAALTIMGPVIRNIFESINGSL